MNVNDKNLEWERNFVQALLSVIDDVISSCDQDDTCHLDKVEKMASVFE